MLIDCYQTDTSTQEPYVSFKLILSRSNARRVESQKKKWNELKKKLLCFDFNVRYIMNSSAQPNDANYILLKILMLLQEITL